MNAKLWKQKKDIDAYLKVQREAMETEIDEMKAQMASQKKETESQSKDMEVKRENQMDKLRAEIKVLQKEKKESIEIFNIHNMYATNFLDKKNKEFEYL